MEDPEFTDCTKALPPPEGVPGGGGRPPVCGMLITSWFSFAVRPAFSGEIVTDRCSPVSAADPPAAASILTGRFGLPPLDPSELCRPLSSRKDALPVKLTARQKELLRELEESSQGDSGRHNPRAKSWMDRVRDFFAAT